MSAALRVFACLLLLAALACKSDSERAAEHLAKGDELATAEKWDEAIIEYKNVVQLEPNNAAGHYGLAKAQLGKRDARSAYWELEETVRLAPANIDARIQHGEFLLLGRSEELERAVASGDAVIAADPKRWEGYALKGRALKALGKHEEAGEAFATAAETAPEQPAPVLLWANHLKTVGKHAEAEVAYRKLAEMAPGFATSAALGGFLAGVEGRDADAEAAYRQALANAKPEEHTFAVTVVANFLASRKRFDEAEASLKEAIAAKPESVDLIYALAGFYNSQGRKAEADQMIEQATQAQPDKPEAWLVLSAHRGRVGDLDGALAAAEHAVEVAPDNDLAKLRRAEVLVDIGHRRQDKTVLAQASAAVDAILEQDDGHPEANFVKAKLELAARKPEAALVSLRKTVDRKPELAQAHFLMASALYLTGDRTGARAEAARALEIEPGFVEARGLLARTHAALGDHALAIEAGKRAIEQGAGPEMRIAVAQSMVQQGQMSDALAELNAIPEAQRGVDAEFALGRVLLFQALAADAKGRKGDARAAAGAAAGFASARAHLEQAAKLAPNNAQVLSSIFLLDQRDGRLDESRQRVSAAAAASPKDAALAQLVGDVAFATGHADEAERSFRRAIEIDPNNLDAYGRLATFLARQNRSAEVLRTYEDALAKNPKSGELHLVIGMLIEAQGEQSIDAAMQHYEQAIQLNPELAAAKNNLAFWLAERGGNLDRALDLAQEAKALLPNNPAAADTLGWVFYKKNLPEAAVNYLREAVGGFPPGDRTLPLVRHHLALALAAKAEAPAAAKEWKQAIAEYEALQKPAGAPDPAWVKEARAGLAKLES